MGKESDPIQKSQIASDIPLDSPIHPCIDCGNRLQGTGAILNNDTVCMDGYHPIFGCRYFFPNTATPAITKDIK
jgi:hypothetical protein